MPVYNSLALLRVLAAAFAYLNQRFLRELIDEVLNALLFVLVGLEALVLRIVGARVAAIGVARRLAVALPLGLRRGSGLFTPSPRRVPVLPWGGLRGGLSVAMALSRPAEAPCKVRMSITYVIVVFSIIGQRLAIGPLVRWLGVAGPPPEK